MEHTMMMMHNGTHNDNSSMHHGMQMFFTSTVAVPHLLFEAVVITEVWQYVLALFICFLGAFLNQFLVFLVKTKIHLPKKVAIVDDELRNVDSYDKLRRRRIIALIRYYTKPLIYLIQNSLGYLVMLVTMTYNTGLFLAVVAGNTLGFTVFCMRANIVTEDCCAN